MRSLPIRSPLRSVCAVVPWRLSDSFVEQDTETRELLLLDDDHALTAPGSLTAILDAAVRCFALTEETSEGR
jgi:hypothetical protein